ncbi:hypothetical protein CKN86_13185 [Carnobacterium divergens]|uniref:hypothetical protein n=1 Tax=Carnobacterium divergens TaxID=2748 RepID=UPI000D43C872|nr:hypothetical protein [Carnobacterium divergens]MCO6017199.1 hypothetical protein [Carnobacterium divergens]MPQ21889.1 hypothetical protein [Carnobacterium divergens]TFI61352.1 hypothetical protein CKN62_13325 [Carnobacterium divergens]TFI88373.1 hypothetical protein CKN84_13215 [Carnobacterium divergens]TFJ02942.1 hypothetical protein CKN86_13185 [Carnobacterium divergens]
MKKKKWWLISLLIVLITILGIGGKRYMDKRATEKEYQQGIELIQSYVSDYLMKNYEGIEKIEWQGVGVEWRNSPIYGPSLLGNYVDSDVKIFVSEDNYFTMTFRLNGETEYNSSLKKYVKLDSLNAENTDSFIKMEIENSTRKLEKKDEIPFEKVKKNTVGSPNAKIIYNLVIYELKY